MVGLIQANIPVYKDRNEKIVRSGWPRTHLCWNTGTQKHGQSHTYEFPRHCS